MITYEPFWKTLKEKEITQYQLIKDYGVRESLLDKLRHDKPIETTTIDAICQILDCKVEDVILFVKE